MKYSAIFLVTCLGMTLSAPAQDIWCNDPTHNMVLKATGLPETFDESTLLWKIEHGAKYGYPMPTIINGMVIHGTGKGGILDKDYAETETVEKSKKYKHLGDTAAAITCRELATGKPIWQIPIPHIGYKLSYGVCTTPIVEKDRYYILAQDMVLCLDINGLTDGNQGMTEQEELEFYRTLRGQPLAKPDSVTTLPKLAGDILWMHPLWQYDVQFEDAASCTPLLIGDQLWISTSSKTGIERHSEDGPPKIVVLDKNTGKLLARDRLPTPYVFHGEWSSPSLMEIDGKKIVIFPDGHGLMHGLGMIEPAEDGSVVDIPTLWTVDLNPKEYRYTEDGKEICYTEDKRLFQRYPTGYPDDTERWEGLRTRNEHRLTGPCETIGRPVIVDNRIYVGLGRDCYYTNTQDGMGRYMCWEVTDPSKEPNLQWETFDVKRTQCTASVKDGLVFIADMAGFLHCLDADTGESIWQEELGKKVILKSQMIADGKVYVAEGRTMFVFEESRSKTKISESKLDKEPSTINAVDGIVVFSTADTVEAYKGPGYTGPVVKAETPASDKEKTE